MSTGSGWPCSTSTVALTGLSGKYYIYSPETLRVYAYGGWQVPPPLVQGTNFCLRPREGAIVLHASMQYASARAISRFASSQCMSLTFKFSPDPQSVQRNAVKWKFSLINFLYASPKPSTIIRLMQKNGLRTTANNQLTGRPISHRIPSYPMRCYTIPMATFSSSRRVST